MDLNEEQERKLAKMKQFYENHKKAIREGRGKPVTNPRLIDGHAIGQDDYPKGPIDLTKFRKYNEDHRQGPLETDGPSDGSNNTYQV